MTPTYRKTRIKVRDLVWSPRNVRGKTPRTRIPELAELIFHYGLLTEPFVTPKLIEDNGVSRVVYETDAGERRRLAMHLLLKQRRWAADTEVDVKVVEGDVAAETSLVENYSVDPMHPADQFLAFKRLVDVEGLSVEDLAARFRLSPVTVRQRLRLGRVAPSLLDGYRDGELNMAQILALAICECPATQEAVWAAAYGWQREPKHLRSALTVGKVNTTNDPVAQFVGLEAYQAAGGLVELDLFSHEHGAFVDKRLLDLVAARQLESTAEQVRCEGWKWVEVRVRLHHDELAEYGRCTSESRPLTEVEALAQATLREKVTLLESALNRLYLEDGERVVSESAVSIEELEGDLDNALCELAAIERGRNGFAASTKKDAGAMVTIAPADGPGSGARAHVIRGLRRPTGLGTDPQAPRSLPGAVKVPAA